MDYIPDVQVARPGVSEEEWFDLRGDDERWYFLKSWYPTEANAPEKLSKPKGAVVFVHGFGEHISRYTNIFKVFADRDYQVTGFDQRGYGRTWRDANDRDAVHGWTTWPDQFRDVSHLLWLIRKRLDDDWGKDTVPIFLMGHSMGGGISTGFFTRPPGEGPGEEVKDLVSGVVLSAPWLDIHFPIPTSVGVALMGVLLRIAPRLRLPLGPPSDDLCRDPLVCRAVREDPLCDTGVYTRGLYDPLRHGPKLVSEGYKRWPQRLPILVAHGTGDKVTKWSCSRDLVDNLKKRGCDATFASFNGNYHENLFEPGAIKIKFANSIIEYVAHLALTSSWMDNVIARRKVHAIESQTVPH
ncbi:acylglycerol lipase [Malassezia vespertilionis]|uniref:Serine aminopeptidase S33 domain-containing protein n=1 Tax=Malassezia vespertilionis TaxID=2020962 RepID=A0A2N1JB91_9BASI|nr:acylglycerol lipase [Malassezia vespertilionis]PKI83805.1 hypothetical protein MVES_002175 [Malassezia vespertilionis]WFD06953.1 acylglycerol lipase [Malassezia vespertilionis]